MPHRCNRDVACGAHTLPTPVARSSGAHGAQLTNGALNTCCRAERSAHSNRGNAHSTCGCVYGSPTAHPSAPHPSALRPSALRPSALHPSASKMPKSDRGQSWLDRGQVGRCVFFSSSPQFSWRRQGFFLRSVRQNSPCVNWRKTCPSCQCTLEPWQCSQHIPAPVVVSTAHCCPWPSRDLLRCRHRLVLSTLLEIG